MRRAQRDAEKAVLTKLRRRLKNIQMDPAAGPCVPEVAFDHGVQAAIKELDDMLKGDSKSYRNRQGQ